MSPSYWSRLVLPVLLTLFLVTLGHAQLPYSESWLGNTFFPTTGNNSYVGSMATLCVATDGTSYTNCIWDEGGNPVREFYSNGACGPGTCYNMGNVCGYAVACNNTYLYFAAYAQGGVNGIVQYNRGNITYPNYVNFITVNATSNAYVMGLAANNSYVYASDPTNNRILQYNAASLAEITSWTCDNCNALALDGSGNLWVLQTGSTPQVSCYNSSGTLQNSVITFAGGDTPTAIAYDSANNRLLITDDGADCNIKVYNLPLAGGSPTPVSTSYGAVGGILSTANGHVVGQVAPLYFNHSLRGIGVDGSGNFTVLDGFVGVVEKYNAQGTQLWIDKDTTYTDIACPDPGQDTDVYSSTNHMTVNYSNPPGQGSQWNYTGYTYNPVKYGTSDMRSAMGVVHSVVRLGGQNSSSSPTGHFNWHFIASTRVRMGKPLSRAP